MRVRGELTEHFAYFSTQPTNQTEMGNEIRKYRHWTGNGWRKRMEVDEKQPENGKDEAIDSCCSEREKGRYENFEGKAMKLGFSL